MVSSSKILVSRVGLEQETRSKRQDACRRVGVRQLSTKYQTDRRGGRICQRAGVRPRAAGAKIVSSSKTLVSGVAVGARDGKREIRSKSSLFTAIWILK